MRYGKNGSVTCGKTFGFFREKVESALDDREQKKDLGMRYGMRMRVWHLEKHFYLG